MPVTRYNGLRKYGRTRFRKRRASVATRAKYQKPTAANQRKQIMGNARMISRVRRLLPQPVFTDWIYRKRIFGAISTDGAAVFQQEATCLVDFSTWNPVLRVSDEVTTEVATHVLRFNINFRYSLVGSSWAQITAYIVTLRKDAASRDPTTPPLQSGSDFVANADLMNARLNSAIYKVHWARNISITNGGWLTDPAVVGDSTFVGNPMTTFRKGNCTIKCNMKIRAPAISSWKNMVPSQISPAQRYYLLTFITSNNTTPIGANKQVRIDMDMLTTCKNTA